MRFVAKELWVARGVRVTKAKIAISAIFVGALFDVGGITGLIGLGSAAAALRWAVAAVVPSVAGRPFARRKISAMSKARGVPKFLDTPPGVLAVAIFGFLARQALKVAARDAWRIINLIVQYRNRRIRVTANEFTYLPRNTANSLWNTSAAPKREWSGRWESNPCTQRGSLLYH